MSPSSFSSMIRAPMKMMVVSAHNKEQGGRYGIGQKVRL